MEQYPITLELKVSQIKAIIALAISFTGCWFFALLIITNWAKFQNSITDSVWAIGGTIALLVLPILLIPKTKQLSVKIGEDKIYCIRGINWDKQEYKSNEIGKISIRAKGYGIKLPSIYYYLLIQKQSEEDSAGYKLLIEDQSLYGGKLPKNNLSILINEIKRLNPRVVVDESIENYLKTGSIKKLDNQSALEEETAQRLSSERKITYSIIIVLLIAYTIYYFL